jgi:hypothetical protein
MNQLPGFDEIATVEPEVKKKLKPRFYLYVKTQENEYFLWKTHTNGGPDWRPMSELGRKVPLLYKTLSGAQRMLKSYVGSGPAIRGKEVRIWEKNLE